MQEKNHLSKHSKNILRNHINEISNPRQAVTDRDEIDFQNPIKNHYLHVQGLEGNKKGLNLPFMENKLDFNFKKNLG